MEKRRIGDLEVTLVGLGCNNFGGRLDQDRTTAVVNAALDAGINLFDTADVYGGGLSEEYLGKALGARRSEVLIATKFASPVDDDPAHRGASARWIGEAVERSLRRLGSDYIDLYQQHRPDPDTPLEETVEALDKLVSEGKVRQVGHSNFDAAMIEQADRIAGDKGLNRFVSAQNQLSLLDRRALNDVVPACARHGLGFLPFFPLANGMLTGKYRRGAEPPAGSRLANIPADRAARAFSDSTFDLIEALEGFASARGHTLLELAFAWLTAQPAMASVIAGATSPEQVKANAAAASWTLTAEDLAELDEMLQAR